MQCLLKIHRLYAALSAAVLCVTLAQAQAIDVPRDYDIPAGELAQAVNRFSQQSDLQVIYDLELLKDKSAPALKGSFAPRDLLTQLLNGTGLQWSYANDNTIVLRRAAVSMAEQDQITVARNGNQSAAMQQVQPDSKENIRNTEEAGPKNAARASEDTTQEIVVTGTNIKGVAPAGSPVIVLDEQAIRRSGYTSVEQVIQALPQNIRSGSEGATADFGLNPGNTAGFNYAGGSGANLRGLGATATLILINGRRIAASTAGTFTDISFIPLSAIERIEVLTDGASAIYGADAVAGVINVILKQDFDGADSRLRLGRTAPSGRDEFRASQAFGNGWDTGNGLVIVDYLKQTRLGTDDRDFTSEVSDPGTIFPENKQLSAILSGTQRFNDKWSVQGDAQVARADRHSTGSSSTQIRQNPVDVERANLALSLLYDVSPNWNVSLDEQGSEEDIHALQRTYLRSAPAASPTITSNQKVRQKSWTTGVRAAGSLFDLPAGNVGVAIGASRRNEEYLRRSLRTDFREEGEREVDSAFAELHLPLFSSANNRPAFQSLALSLAGRYDDYSDFGSTFNPKVGISWRPVNGLELRSSYSTSFRAPSTGAELATSASGTFTDFLLVASYFTPDGTATVPAVHLLGSNTLSAEEAKNWTVGFTFRPERIAGLQVGVTYYDIEYTNRIVVPDFDRGALSNPAMQRFITSYSSPAALQAAVSALLGQTTPLYLDATGLDNDGGAYGPNPENLATYIVDYRYTNAGLVNTSGLDFLVDYVTDVRGGTLAISFNASRINEIDTSFAPLAPTIDLSNTTGNPARLRLRSSVAYMRGKWDAALAVNRTNSYIDTSGIANSSVDAFVTADATIRYLLQNSSSFLDNLSLSLSVSNVFNEDPPFVQASGSGSHYDTANADPLGRLISFEVGKRW